MCRPLSVGHPGRVLYLLAAWPFAGLDRALPAPHVASAWRPAGSCRSVANGDYSPARAGAPEKCARWCTPSTGWRHACRPRRATPRPAGRCDPRAAHPADRHPGQPGRHPGRRLPADPPACTRSWKRPSAARALSMTCAPWRWPRAAHSSSSRRADRPGRPLLERNSSGVSW